MKAFLFIVTILAAALADWAWGYVLPAWFPPLPAAAILFWFIYFNFTARLAAALAGGLMLDSVYPVPFGAYTAVLLILALAAQFLKILVVHTATLLGRALVFGALLILGAALLPFVLYIMENIAS